MNFRASVPTAELICLWKSAAATNRGPAAYVIHCGQQKKYLMTIYSRYHDEQRQKGN